MTPFISGQMCLLTSEWMPSINYAPVWCRMWPSMWIFDRCACFPYLHPSHTLSLSLSYYLHLPVFLSLAFSLYPSSNFRNFPLGAVQVLRPKLEGALSFPTFLVLPPPDHLNYCLHKKQTNKRNTQKKRFFRNKLIWSSFMLFIHENAQCAPEEWLFDPPVDQDLWPPCWSWDLVLPSSPRGATGNKLLWHSGLCSHGEAHYCSHMAG